MKKLWDSVSSTAKDGFGLHCPRFLLEDEGGQRSARWHNFQGMLLPTLVPILFSLGKEAYRNLKLNWLKQKGGYYSCSVAKSCLTLGPLGQEQARLPCPSLHWNLLRLTSIELVMPSNHLILCCLLLLLPLIFPSIRIFSNELALRIRWLKYWSFNFSISPSNEYSGLISFRMDWFDVQGTLKSLLIAPQRGY